MTAEIVLMWTAVTLYAAGSVLFAAGIVFQRDRILSMALRASLAGLVPHAAAIIVRWVRVGHGPYLGYYEVVSSYAWFSVVALGILAWRWKGLRNIGAFLMPINQRGGVQSLESVTQSLPLSSVQDYEDWLSRMAAVDEVIEQIDKALALESPFKNRFEISDIGKFFKIPVNIYF